MQNRISRLVVIGGGLLLTLGILLHFLRYSFGMQVPSGVLLVTRVLFLALLFLYAVRQRSLTTWILIAMLAGIECGYDLPAISQKLEVVSEIFLRLIKTIIAPLLFGTLVAGIAGHSNMKQLGRIGWKSILYFEAVTTVALFIGLAAINITRAGIGIHLPATVATQGLPTVAPQTAHDLILHIFPENIARAVAEGNVL
ncbi:MAG TPA: cation:dicarboxylase symporter family transporter, partial [Bacteroidales bacterium]|nr:cation:dicarboxylase symporter family transporter [Bacteroidales bacterium]